MKKNAISPITLVGGVLVIVLLLYNIYVYFTETVKTEIVSSGVIENVVTTEGYSVRDEKILLDKEGGIINSYVAEGERVSKGMRVAAYYNANVDADKQEKLKNLNERILNLERLKNNSKVSADGSVATDAITTDKVPEIVRCAHIGSGAYLNNIKLELEELIDEKIASDSEDVTTLIEELKTEKNNIEKSITGEKKDIYATTAGVYSIGKDDYENVLSYEKTSELSVKDFYNLSVSNDTKTDTGAIKIVNNYEWRLVAVVPEKKISSVKKGTLVNLRFSDYGNEMYKAEIIHISEPSSGKVVLVLQADSFAECVFNNRKLNVDIVFSTESGLKISKDAVKVINSQTGVYIIKKSTVRFRKINILASDDKYVIVEEDNSEGGGNLMLYDEIVVSGEVEENEIIK